MRNSKVCESSTGFNILFFRMFWAKARKSQHKPKSGLLQRRARSPRSPASNHELRCSWISGKLRECLRRQIFHVSNLSCDAYFTLRYLYSDPPFRYAGIQDSGKACFCGAGYGRYGLGVCRSPCGDDSEEVCGGNLTSSVYQTNVNGETISLRWPGGILFGMITICLLVVA